ncbi:hypothetical protein LJC44_05620, partial [Parabacteroides sp. OttesenSCG-928-G06]|nr:hypothetical protein [Parabacteroides sp. OttesenSCG-928-G06]
QHDLNRIKACNGELTGVTPAVHLSNRAINRSSTTQLPILLEKTENGFAGQLFLLDGDTGDPLQKVTHEVILQFTLHDGRQITSRLDMGGALFDIKRQGIRVNIDASLDSEAEMSLVYLECDSVSPESSPATL